MKLILRYSLLILMILASATALEAQKKRKKKKRRKRVTREQRMLMKRWTAENIEKNERIINIQEFGGEVLMKFTRDEVTITMGGEDQVFPYLLVDGVVTFPDVEGWSEMRIVSVSKTRLELKQWFEAMGDFVQWNLVLYKE